MKNTPLRFASVLLILIICFVTSALHAQSGMLDPSFGSGGIVTTDIAGDDDWCNVIFVEPDGRILVAGATGVYGYNTSMALICYTADGSLDPAFGTGGIVTTAFCPTVTEANAMAYQTDGKIILAGYYDSPLTHRNNFGMVRYHNNGTVDSSFGIDGIASTAFADEYDYDEDGEAYDVEIQADGKIVLAGNLSWQGEVVIARYNTDGSPDMSFGTAGVALGGFGPYDDCVVHSMKIQPDGKIVVTGYDDLDGYYYVLTARFNTDGSPDLSFGTGGRVLLLLSEESNNTAHSIALQADGKILIGASSSFDACISYCTALHLIRYNTDGTLDGTFGAGGIITDSINLWSDGSQDPSDIEVQPDQKIVFGGKISDGYKAIYAVYRYNADGTPDSSFDDDGLVTTDLGFENEHSIRAVALQPDGRIVVCGNTYVSSSQDFAMARYLSCSADFALYPDTIPHNWNALNMASGVAPLTYSWEWGDGSTASDAYPSHVYADSGYYNICLTITDASGCVATHCDSSTFIYRMSAEASMVTVNVVAELPEVIGGFTEPETLSVSVVPNPFSKVFILQKTDMLPAQLILSDLTGNEILRQYVYDKETTISAEDLQPGIYVITLLEAGRKMYGKIVKL